MSVQDVLARTGPRKLLALDGGGILGLISLGFLMEMENLLRERLGKDQNFVLADYFDYIAGNSTGAIIAAGLALGMKVEASATFTSNTAQRCSTRIGSSRRRPRTSTWPKA